MNAHFAGSHSLSRSNRLLTTAGLLLAAALLGSAPVQALPAHPDDEAAEAKSAASVRALRLSYVEGGVQVIQDGQVIADPALANQPIFEGTQILTANDGQAEVQLEDGSVARLSPNSALTFSVIAQDGSGSRTEIVLNSGLAYFELQPSTPEHRLRINYGATSFTASSFTVARVLADQPPAEIAVFSGNVDLKQGGSTQLTLHGGESLSLNSSDGNGYSISETIEQNSWDSWNADRDELLNSEVAEKTSATGSVGVSAGPGISDLDANGSWYNVPDQGYVWSPYVAQSVGVGWDPYGYGHWVYYPRRGYIWVSGYGWGYAPFSCGLWNYYDNFGWGWAPGGGCGGFWGGGGGYFGGGWYGGGGGWYNIGHYPAGYAPPRRPGNPSRPQPVGGPKRPLSIVTVDRRVPGAQNPVVAGGPRQPVTIGGRQVEPLRPINPRQSYDGSGGSGVVGNRNGGGASLPSLYGVDGRSGYPGNPRPTTGLRPGGMPTGQPGYQPSYRPSSPQGGGRPQPTYQPPRSSQPPASRPSGGGGGAVPHPSGGGGGGGSHPSGGSPHK